MGKVQICEHLIIIIRFDFMQAKCEKYWTEEGDTKDYGPISVTCVSIHFSITTY